MSLYVALTDTAHTHAHRHCGHLGAIFRMHPGVYKHVPNMSLFVPNMSLNVLSTGIVGTWFAFSSSISGYYGMNLPYGAYTDGTVKPGAIVNYPNPKP